ncbi:MAG: DUF3830 family protein [Nitrososphaerales archaeon]
MMTSRPRKLLLDLDGVTATASLFEERAPKTCEAVWSILPVSGRSIHANWSGREVMLHLEGDKILRLPQEVPVHSNYIYEGDIHYFYRASSLSRGKQLAYSAQFQRELSEFAIFYGEPAGEGLSAYDPPRTPHLDGVHVVCKFAALDRPIPEAFRLKCESTRHEGLKPLTVSRLE